MSFRGNAFRYHGRWLLFDNIFLYALLLLSMLFVGCGSSIQSQLSADQYLKKAQTLSQNFQHREALQYYEKAWQIYKTVADPEKQAKILYNMGNLHCNLQEYEEALQDYKHALQFLSALEKTDQIRIFNNIGVIYRYLGQYAEARKYFDKALTMRPATPEQLTKEDFIVQLNQAVALIKLEQPQPALSILDHLLTFQDDSTYYRYEIALTYAIRGILEATDFPERAFRNLPQARADHQQALNVFQELERKYDLAFVYHNLGLLDAKQQCYQEALTYYQKSLDLAEEIGDDETAWLAYYNMGNTYRALSKPDNAKQNYEKSINIIESIRSKLSIDDFKMSFMEDKSKVYQALINLLLEVGTTEEAFDYLERAKSRALVDLLGAQKISPRKRSNVSLMQETEEKIQSLRQKQEAEYLKPKEQRAAMIPLTRELHQAKQDYQELLQQIQRENPEYASLISVKPFTLGEIQKHIPARTALLEYLILEDRTLIFILTPETFHVETVAVTQKCLQGTILAWRMEIEREMPGWQTKSHWLYSQLIGPAEQYLEGIDTLCIIPYGSLHTLPFGAFVLDEPQTGSDSPGKLLVERYNLFYAPSATVWQFAVEKSDKQVSPDFTPQNQPNQGLIVANSDLEYAQEEAEGIQQSYRQATILIGSEATKAAVQKLAADARLLHFATHGLLDSTSPLFSALRLADSDLAVHEIFNDLNLKQNTLVTLSACSTALGKKTAGDEIIGLTRAFLYAGAPSVIASLWAVDDRSTALLIQRFYKNFSTTNNKAESLRYAQISLLRDAECPAFQHPYYWAAFELIGDSR